MKNPETHFKNIASRCVDANTDVKLGKMMHSPGLKYKEKVFAFFHKNEMGFRLGPIFNAEKFGLKNAKPLNPFKTKPPLKGWFMVEAYEINSWETLAEMALAYTKTI